MKRYPLLAQFEDSKVPGLKEDLEYAGWDYLEKKDGITIMIRFIRREEGDNRVTAAESRHLQEFRKLVSKHEKERDKEFDYYKDRAKQNRKDMNNLLTRSIFEVNKTPARKVIADNKAKMLELGLTQAKYVRAKNVKVYRND